MDKILENSLLFDFYGELLTDKKKEILSLYIEEDLSLSEIASRYDITRQCVYDTIKTSQKLLEEYENKLGLVQKFVDHKKELEQVLKMLDDLDYINKEKINEIRNKIKGII